MWQKFLYLGLAGAAGTIARYWLSEDLPIIIEIADEPEKIVALLPELDKMITEGLVTLEKIRVIAYRYNSTGN